MREGGTQDGLTVPLQLARVRSGESEQEKVENEDRERDERETVSWVGKTLSLISCFREHGGQTLKITARSFPSIISRALASGEFSSQD